MSWRSRLPDWPDPSCTCPCVCESLDEEEVPRAPSSSDLSAKGASDTSSPSSASTCQQSSRFGRWARSAAGSRLTRAKSPTSGLHLGGSLPISGPGLPAGKLPNPRRRNSRSLDQVTSAQPPPAPAAEAAPVPEIKVAPHDPPATVLPQPSIPVAADLPAATEQSEAARELPACQPGEAKEEEDDGFVFVDNLL